MIYAKLTAEKTFTFLGLIFGLALTLVFTFSVKKYIPSDYFSINGALDVASLHVDSWINRADFALGDRGLSVAGILEALHLQNSEAVSISGARDVPVLLYHGITEKPDRFSMTPETFKDQMFALKKAGYHTVSMEDFYEFIMGKKSLDNKSFLLTFDDGRQDSYYGADPVLRALDYSAVMFVATGDSLLTPDAPHSYYLHTPLLSIMAHSGHWELESHAIQANTAGGFIPIDASGKQGQFLSNKMWLSDFNRIETTAEYRARITEELQNSKSDLSKTFGVPVISMSYPFGDFGQQTLDNPLAETIIRTAMGSTYSLAFQQVWPNDDQFVSNYSGDDPYHLRRIETDTSWTGKELLQYLERGRTKDVVHTDTLVSAPGWKKTWGDVHVEGNALRVQSSALTTGAFAFLDGTSNLKDYLYTVVADRNKGSYTSLIARYQNSNNYVKCSFSNERVSIVQKIDGTEETLLNIPNLINIPDNKTSLGISVAGPLVRCYEGSRVAAFSYHLNDTALPRGGIAVQVWDKAPNNASSIITSMKIILPDSVAEFKKNLPDYRLSINESK